ncbi:Ldh family oxidoreductase [Rhizobium ruizarguesonis]|uniref:Ldh family oxidoreductase n=1 Tax=Rhizobium ruizarguesonis TaxID=2081791 RepID=UPI001030F1BE|nr:Ldh family oxidoreductase [Rhizobium ruizarguesonis]TBA11990.1 Ldh family oxidoreductase [Rhizobium ruizarguesonis]
MSKCRILPIDAQVFITEAFRSEGFADQSAQEAAETLIYADIAGYSSHGISNFLPIYAHALHKGYIHPANRLTIRNDGGAVLALEAQGMMGLMAGRAAMNTAIERAAIYGVAAVTVSHSSHFGAAGFYSSMAMRKDMIGIAMTNLGAQPVAHAMASRNPIIGTNPIAMAAPVRDLAPFVLDMSTTVCASGKIKQANILGESCPPGWLLNASGESEVDPASYFDGESFLPTLGGWSMGTGGHKGYGLNLLVEVLCGLLAGADVPTLGKAGLQNNIGHFFLVLDIRRWSEPADFAGRMKSWCESLLGQATFPGFPQISYPGHPDGIHAEQTRMRGFLIAEEVFRDLNSYAASRSLSPLQGASEW